MKALQTVYKILSPIQFEVVIQCPYRIMHTILYPLLVDIEKIPYGLVHVCQVLTDGFPLAHICLHVLIANKFLIFVILPKNVKNYVAYEIIFLFCNPIRGQEVSIAFYSRKQNRFEIKQREKFQKCLDKILLLSALTILKEGTKLHSYRHELESIVRINRIFYLFFIHY